MNGNEEWKAASRRLMADERRRLDPPSAEEMLAYTRGELTPEEEERLQERLVCHLDLVRTLTEPFPAAAEPGDPDYLSDAQLEPRWAALQARMRRGKRPASPRVLRFWRASAALAAMLALVFGVLLWRAETKMSEPRLVVDDQVLFPEGRRGAATDANVLTAEGETVLLLLSLNDERVFDRYRIAIVDRAERIVWGRDGLTRHEEKSFAILVPRRFFKPGTYRLVLYGSAGAAEEKVATYALHVPRR